MSARAALLALALSLPLGAGAEPWTFSQRAVHLGGARHVMHAPYRGLAPMVSPAGRAWRFDGNSTWAVSDADVRLDPEEGFAVGAWVAIASPPVEGSAIVDLNGGEAGVMRLGVSPWLQPEFRLGPLRAASFEALPLGRWVHLAARYDGRAARLYVDGREVARHEGSAPVLEGPFTIGRRPGVGRRYDTHPLGVWNGGIGDLRLERGRGAEVAPSGAPGGPADLRPPPSWFATDRHRPRAHPMPPAGWTNEPHALLRRDGLWHLYHQANPNGAFWSQIVWGHLVSEDLVTWEARPPALMPSTGFDRRGVWVGNWIPGLDPPEALYTGVDGHRSGLGRAVWREGGRLERAGPAIAYDTPQGYQDMRDPYVVRTEGGWLALIGAGARDREEALILAFRSQDAREWRFIGEFDAGGARMPGEYWELPVLRAFGDRWMLMGTPVIEGEAARTLYWTGAFDGARFTPDDPEPRRFDLFGTLLAPTLAQDDEGRAVAIGVMPDKGQRGEETRARAGWVHALSLPFVVEPCEEDAQTLCQSLAPALGESFARVVREQGETDLDEGAVMLDHGPRPVLVRAALDVPEGGTVEIGLRATRDGERATRLILRPSEGRATLDDTQGRQADWPQGDVIEGRMRPSGRIEAEIVIDHAAISGTIGEQAFGVLLYPEPGRDTLVLRGQGGARLERLEMRARPGG